MKNIISIAFLAIIVLLTVSCEDYLDKDPEVDTQLTYQEIFSDVHYAPGFLNNIYNNLPDGYSRFDGAMLAEACDEAVCSNAGASINLFNKNAINASNNPDDVWSGMYSGIRKCNIFLKELEPDGIITKSKSIPDEDDKDYYKGQALFLRGFFHFELLKRYGNIFYITKVIDPLNDEEVFSEEQITFDQAVEKIVADFDSAAVLMPGALPDTSYRGRPISSTPLAFKSRVLLYAASPLNNPGNDFSKWLRAAEAAKVIVDSKKYTLTSLSSIFTSPYNSEIIFAAAAFKRNNIEKYNYPVSYQGAGYLNPTEDLVQSYGMASKTYTGRFIDYDPNDPYSLVNTKKREDRLRYTVYYNGSRLKDTVVESYVGGKDGLFSSSTATKTGYYLSKFMDPALDIVKGEESPRGWVFMRYAEILLNYAEALNEYDNVSNFAQITSILDILRNRANLRPFSAADKTLLQNQDEMRKYIKLERRLELAFEEHRFWDLRRWKDAEVELNKPVKGMRINLASDGTYTYSEFEADSRVFDPKLYWYPIPRNEILKYQTAGKTIVQNPGWD
ncbi:MAG: RagB/SusD family nutrient uptake outer membrane protein [Salinivirgaceae bacterium]